MSGDGAPPLDGDNFVEGAEILATPREQRGEPAPKPVTAKAEEARPGAIAGAARIVAAVENAEILARPGAAAEAERASNGDSQRAKSSLSVGAAAILATLDSVRILHSPKFSRSLGQGGDGPTEPPPQPPDSPPGDSGGGDDRDDGIVEELNREFAFVLMGSRAVIMRETPDAPIEDRARVLSLDAFRAYLSNQSSVVTRRERQADGTWLEVKRRVKWAPQWLNSKQRRTYDGIEFFPDPDNAAGTPRYFNLWRGFSVEPDPSPPATRGAKYAIFRDHLLTNIADGDRAIFNWVWAWFAHILQRPRERVGTALALRGKMGTGKTKVGEVIGSLFASHYFLVDDPRYVTGQFNAHMASCLLLQADEGFWAGDKAAEGRLKGLITAGKQMIEAKGVDPIRLDNYVRLLISSNENWLIPAGMDERRFCVLDVAPHAAQNHDYFAEMDAQLANGGREALLADLLSLDLDAPGAPNLRVIPKTEALLEQKVRSFDPVTAWWFEKLVDGAPTRRRGGWDDCVPTDTLFDDYVHTAERIGVRRKNDKATFSRLLRKLVPSIRNKRRSISVETETGREMRRVCCFELPSLAECRQSLEASLGQNIDWSSFGAIADEE